MISPQQTVEFSRGKLDERVCGNCSSFSPSTNLCHFFPTPVGKSTNGRCSQFSPSESFIPTLEKRLYEFLENQQPKVNDGFYDPTGKPQQSKIIMP